MDSVNADESEWEYDVCLSYAGEQRRYVEQVAARLRQAAIRVFYDEYEKVALWGQDLYERLDQVYRRTARYCVLFASADYARKIWPDHERRSVMARALHDSNIYLLPVRFDDTEIPGLRPTIGYIDLRLTTPAELADHILEKLGTRPRRLHRFTWPAAYPGQVWVLVMPPAETAGRNHDVELRWGPWRRRVSLPIEEGGITLITSKAAEDTAVRCEVEITPAARAIFGTGNVKNREMLDISHGWERA
jgi:hypothetical protein